MSKYHARTMSSLDYFSHRETAIVTRSNSITMNYWRRRKEEKEKKQVMRRQGKGSKSYHFSGKHTSMYDTHGGYILISPFWLQREVSDCNIMAIILKCFGAIIVCFAIDNCSSCCLLLFFFLLSCIHFLCY